MRIKETAFLHGSDPAHAEVELEVCALKEGPVIRVRFEGGFRYYNLDRSQFLQLATDCINAVNASNQ